jgi:hypothetical protein
MRAASFSFLPILDMSSHNYAEPPSRFYGIYPGNRRPAFPPLDPERYPATAAAVDYRPWWPAMPAPLVRIARYEQLPDGSRQSAATYTKRIQVPYTDWGNPSDGSPAYSNTTSREIASGFPLTVRYGFLLTHLKRGVRYRFYWHDYLARTAIMLASSQWDNTTPSGTFGGATQKFAWGEFPDSEPVFYGGSGARRASVRIYTEEFMSASWWHSIGLDMPSLATHTRYRALRDDFDARVRSGDYNALLEAAPGDAAENGIVRAPDVYVSPDGTQHSLTTYASYPEGCRRDFRMIGIEPAYYASVGVRWSAPDPVLI